MLYLNVAVECSVMQGRATGSVRDVDIGQERDEVLIDEFVESSLRVPLIKLWILEFSQSQNDVEVLLLGDLLNTLRVIDLLLDNHTELVQLCC